MIYGNGMLVLTALKNFIGGSRKTSLRKKGSRLAATL
jgi:hypothetical protein